MLVQLRPAERLRGRNGSLPKVLDAILSGAIGDPSLDLTRLRVVCEWLQYRRNFRDVIEVRDVLGGGAAGTTEIAVDLRRALEAPGELGVRLGEALVHHRGGTSDRLYLEPWSPTSRSTIWRFNALYWKELALWEQVSGRTYEQALPGGESDARNGEAARETILRLFATWDHLAQRRALPDQLPVLELGVGNGSQARVWLDACKRLDAELGRDYYRRLQYLMGDYSPHLLDLAREAVRAHADHVSTLVLDALEPTKTLGFLKYKMFFIYISNVYDNLRTDEIARIDGSLYQVESRAYLTRADASRIGGEVNAQAEEVPELIRRLLKLGPELLAETAPERFASPLDAVRLWRDAWESVRLEERYAASQPFDTADIVPGVPSETLRSIIESHGDLRMHLSGGAATSFVDTLQLLHPHGVLACHDIFVTDVGGYATAYRGPGKYDGSVVNWVNGPFLRAAGGRHGFDVTFEPFAHRSGSNITTMLAEVRE
jgi:hypothetical protein